MGVKITSEGLKKLIFEAFKDVRKGQGLGVRECVALDDYASKEEQLKARTEDVEQHWWDYPQELKEYSFDYALIYNNVDGVRFHLPALMTAVIDGLGNTSYVSVFMTLCIQKIKQTSPHHGDRQYVDYLRSIDIKEKISAYGFTKDQVHAIGLYLLWYQGAKFSESRADRMVRVKKHHETFSGKVPKSNYSLTLDDAMAIEDEENRMVRDWLTAGGVNSAELIFEDDV